MKCVGALAAFALATGAAGAAGEGAALQPPKVVARDAARGLVVLQLSDVHLGEDPAGSYGPGQDANSLDAVASVLDKEKPDLVVVSGDAVTAEGLGSLRELEFYYDRLVGLMEKRNIPWCLALGNHDACDRSGCLHGPTRLGPNPDQPVAASIVMGPVPASLASLPSRARTRRIPRRPTTELLRGTARTKHAGPNGEVRSDIQGQVDDIFRAGNTFPSQVQPQPQPSQPTAPNPAAPSHSAKDPYRWGKPFPHMEGPMRASSRGALRRALLAHDRKHVLSRSGNASGDLSYKAEEGGASNYVVEAYAKQADVDAGKPMALLWFLDTGGGDEPEGILQDHVEWLKEAQKKLKEKYGKELPGALFMHIPPQEYDEVNPQAGECAGTAADHVVYPTITGKSSDLVATVKSLGISWFFAGHSHGSDWCCPSGTATLCLGRQSGFGGYSMQGMSKRGARVLRIMPWAPSAYFSSWVRLEDGTATAAFPLGAEPA